MEEKDIEVGGIALIGLIAIVLFCFFTLFYSYESRIANIKREAIEAGVAKYIINERTGETDFVWIKK